MKSNRQRHRILSAHLLTHTPLRLSLIVPDAYNVQSVGWPAPPHVKQKNAIPRTKKLRKKKLKKKNEHGKKNHLCDNTHENPIYTPQITQTFFRHFIVPFLPPLALKPGIGTVPVCCSGGETITGWQRRPHIRRGVTGSPRVWLGRPPISAAGGIRESITRARLGSAAAGSPSIREPITSP
jgi:hypothetical protein